MPRNPRKPEQAAVVTLTDLEQIKLLAEPIRLRLLGAFCEERTTKQVADEIGEKPTRLYHHVEALERAGLIVLTRTAPNRGTTEKYYQSIARAFRAEAGVVSAPDDGSNAELASVVRGMLSTTADEADALLAAGDRAVLEEGVLSFLELHVAPRHAELVRNELMSLLERIQQLGDDADAGEESTESDETNRYRLAIAYFQLEK